VRNHIPEPPQPTLAAGNKTKKAMLSCEGPLAAHSPLENSQLPPAMLMMKKMRAQMSSDRINTKQKEEKYRMHQ